MMDNMRDKNIMAKKRLRKSTNINSKRNLYEQNDMSSGSDTSVCKSVTLTIVDPNGDVRHVVSDAQIENRENDQTTYLWIPTSVTTDSSDSAINVKDLDVDSIQKVEVNFSDDNNINDPSGISFFTEINETSEISKDNNFYTIEAAGNILDDDYNENELQTIECFEDVIKECNANCKPVELMTSESKKHNFVNLNHNIPSDDSNDFNDDITFIMKKQLCLVCDRSISAHENKSVFISGTHTTCTQTPVATLLGRVVGDSLSILMNTEEMLCWKCFSLLELLDALEQRMQQTCNKLVLQYWATVDTKRPICVDEGYASTHLCKKSAANIDSRICRRKGKQLSSNCNFTNFNKKRCKNISYNREETTMSSERHNNNKGNVSSKADNYYCDDTNNSSIGYSNDDRYADDSDNKSLPGTGKSTIELKEDNSECNYTIENHRISSNDLKDFANSYLRSDSILGSHLESLSPGINLESNDFEDGYGFEDTVVTEVNQETVGESNAGNQQISPSSPLQFSVSKRKIEQKPTKREEIRGELQHRIKLQLASAASDADVDVTAEGKLNCASEISVTQGITVKKENNGYTADRTEEDFNIDHARDDQTEDGERPKPEVVKRKKGRPRKEHERSERRPSQRVYVTPELFKKCPCCRQIFLHHHSLEQHLQQEHPSCRRREPCISCNTVFTTYDTMDKCPKCYRFDRLLDIQNTRPGCSSERHLGECPTSIEDENKVRPVLGITKNKYLTKALYKKMLKCVVCKIECESNSTLYNHLKSEHPELFPHGCDSCNIRFRSKNMLNKHLLMHVDGRLECPKCCLNFNKISHLQDHLSCSHPDFNDFICSLCGNKVPSLDAFLTHVRVRHGTILGLDLSFACSDCEKKFHTGTALGTHRAIYHPNAATCSICGLQTTPSYLPVHVNAVHTKKRQHACDKCDKLFYSRTNLTAHTKRHHMPRPLHCEFCGKGHVNAAELRRHIKGHKNERDFKCDMCSRTFLKQIDLTYHRRSHTGERPHVCNVCCEGFARPTSLKSHLEKHSYLEENSHDKHPKGKDDLSCTHSPLEHETKDSNREEVVQTIDSKTTFTELGELAEEIPDFSREELVPFDSELQLSVVQDIGAPLLEEDFGEQLLMSDIAGSVLEIEEDEGIAQTDETKDTGYGVQEHGQNHVQVVIVQLVDE